MLTLVRRNLVGLAQEHLDEYKRSLKGKPNEEKVKRVETALLMLVQATCDRASANVEAALKQGHNISRDVVEQDTAWLEEDKRREGAFDEKGVERVLTDLRDGREPDPELSARVAELDAEADAVAAQVLLARKRIPGLIEAAVLEEIAVQEANASRRWSSARVSFVAGDEDGSNAGDLLQKLRRDLVKAQDSLSGFVDDLVPTVTRVESTLGALARARSERQSESDSNLALPIAEPIEEEDDEHVRAANLLGKSLKAKRVKRTR